MTTADYNIEIKVSIDRANASLKRLNSSVTRVQKNAKGAERNMVSFGSKGGSAIGGLIRQAGALAAVFATGFVVKGIVSTIAEFERLRTVLNTVTGSIENGKVAFDFIEEFASNTPFEIKNLVNSFNILAARGIRPASKEFEAFGNIAAATGVDITQVAEAVADAATGEFERLKELGIIIRKEGETVKLTVQGITTTVKNDTKTIIDELVKIGQTNFADAMEAQSKTLGGIFSNIKDTIGSTIKTLGEGGLKDAMKEVALEFKKFITVDKELVLEMGQKLGDAIRSTVKAIVWLKDNFVLVKNVLISLGAAKAALTIVGLAKAAYTAAKGFKTLRAALISTGIGAIPIIVGAAVLAYLQFKDVIDNFALNTLGSLRIAWAYATAGIVTQVKIIGASWKAMKEAATGNFEPLKNLRTTIKEIGQETLDNIEALKIKVNGEKEARNSELDLAKAIKDGNEPLKTRTQLYDELSAAEREKAIADAVLAKIEEDKIAAGKKLTEQQGELKTSLDATIANLTYEADVLEVGTAAATRRRIEREAEVGVLNKENQALLDVIDAKVKENNIKRLDKSVNNSVTAKAEQLRLLQFKGRELAIETAISKKRIEAQKTNDILTKTQIDNITRIEGAYFDQAEQIRKTASDAEDAKRKAIDAEKLKQREILKTTKLLQKQTAELGESFGDLVGNILTGGGIGGAVTDIVGGAFDIFGGGKPLSFGTSLLKGASTALVGGLFGDNSSREAAKKEAERSQIANRPVTQIMNFYGDFNIGAGADTLDAQQIAEDIAVATAAGIGAGVNEATVDDLRRGGVLFGPGGNF